MSMSRASSSQLTDFSTSSPAVVINTRPVERAAPLTEYLQAAGLTVVDIPMLTLQPRAVSDADIELMRRWLAGDYQALVIVSPTAAASGLAVWQALAQEKQQADTNKPSGTIANELGASTAPSHIIAVGEATASVLQDPKLHPNYQVLKPIIANNEGMLAMPEIEHLQAGDKLLVWRGLGGRRLLANTLKERGVQIDSIAWYERTLPVDASANYQQWHSRFTARDEEQPLSKPVVIVSSGTAFEHWASVVAQKQASVSDSGLEQASALTLSDFNYVVLGERLTNMLAEKQLRHWRVEDLSPATILDAIQSDRLS